ncbi:evolutionarily conserved signaling intermediate in Toll pathway, mitochondrial-like isoform X2 [Ptychodera flava]|uniref:evolutionarily conserved signaling intermediate in Toll pathway, mitochondrial-like isoform X2 n=1 Tax=Ptychodera flava TaxID=63121 RepID=UPI003969D341
MNYTQSWINKGVMPNEETKGVLLSVFGRKGHPIRKLQRMLYWFYKFRHVNPFPLPKELPEDPIAVAELGLQRISDYDAKFEVFKYTSNTGRESFIAQVMSPEQKELLAEHPTHAPVYVEGGYNLWLRDKKVSYFVLRADNITLVPSEEKTTQDIEGIAVHREGTVFAICMTSDNSQESLRTWISSLQDTNPNLANLPVMFNVHQISDTRDITSQTAS